jgi:hypothetical protein
MVELELLLLGLVVAVELAGLEMLAVEVHKAQVVLVKHQQLLAQA